MTPGKTISVTNFATTNGNRVGISISTNDRSVTLTLHGSRGPVLFEVPVFVDNIATASAGTVVETTGTVGLSAEEPTVTVQLRHA